MTVRYAAAVGSRIGYGPQSQRADNSGATKPDKFICS